MRVELARSQIRVARELFHADPTMASIAQFLSEDMDAIERLLRATRTELEALEDVVVRETHDV